MQNVKAKQNKEPKPFENDDDQDEEEARIGEPLVLLKPKQMSKVEDYLPRTQRPTNRYIKCSGASGVTKKNPLRKDKVEEELCYLLQGWMI